VVEERARVRLDWRLPDGLTPVEPVIETATLNVEGVQAFVRTVRQKELSIVIDLSKAKEGEVNLDLSDRPVVGLPAQVRVASIVPGSLKLKLDRIQKRRLEVNPVTKGEVADGFRLAGVHVTPDRVELAGPSTVLRDLTEVPTDPVDVSGLKENAEFDVGLNVPRGQLSPTSPVTFAVEVDVEPVVREQLFEEVPVTVSDDRYTTTVTTAKVKFEGPSSRISSFDADEVRVVVKVPDGYDGPGGAARSGTGPGLHYEVEQPGGADVKVTTVDPAVIPVVRK
jgi:YbbR domain-containing protein